MANVDRYKISNSLLTLCTKRWLRPSALINRTDIETYENLCITKVKYTMHKVDDYGSVLFTSGLITQLYVRADILHIDGKTLA